MRGHVLSLHGYPLLDLETLLDAVVRNNERQDVMTVGLAIFHLTKTWS